MANRRFEGMDALIGPLYFVSLLLILTPVMDFTSSVLPARAGNIEWRFASVGLLSGFLLTPVLGIVLSIVIAAWAGHLRFQRVIAIVNLAAVLLLAGLMVMFLLDIFQLRNAVQAEAKASFEGAALKAVLKYLAVMIGLGWLGWRGLGASSWSVPSEKRAAGAVVIGT